MYLVLVVVVALLLCACGGDTTVSTEAIEPAGADAAAAMAGLPFPDEAKLVLPPLPAHEVSGATILYPFGGNAYLDSSPAVFAGEFNALIPAALGEMEYAVYGAFNGGGELLDVELFFEQAGPDCWIGFANFQTGRWELERLPEVSPHLYDMSTRSELFSANGNVFFALVAFSGSNITASNYKCRVHNGDFAEHVLVSNGGNAGISLAAIDGRPGIAIYDSTANFMRFAHASDTTPESADDWVFSHVDIQNSPSGHLVLREFEGKPVIAYTTTLNDLRFAFSAVASPTLPEDWTTTVVDTGGSYRFQVTMLVRNGQPEIAFYEQDFFDANDDQVFGYIRHAWHEGTDLTTGWHPYRLANAGTGNTEPALIELAGTPAVAFVNTAAGELSFAHADIAQPTEHADWQVHSTDIDADGGRTRMNLVNGKPWIVFDRADIARLAASFVEVPNESSEWEIDNFYVASTVAPAAFDFHAPNGRADFYHVQRIDFIPPPIYPMYLQRTLDKRTDLSGHSLVIPAAVGTEVSKDGLSLAYVDGQPVGAFVDPVSDNVMFSRLHYDAD